jgi:hypothetical protein
MRRREFIAGLGAAACPLLARAQQPAPPVIGYLGSQSADDSKVVTVPFLQGLERTWPGCAARCPSATGASSTLGFPDKGPGSQREAATRTMGGTREAFAALCSAKKFTRLWRASSGAANVIADIDVSLTGSSTKRGHLSGPPLASARATRASSSCRTTMKGRSVTYGRDRLRARL